MGRRCVAQATRPLPHGVRQGALASMLPVSLGSSAPGRQPTKLISPPCHPASSYLRQPGVGLGGLGDLQRVVLQVQQQHHLPGGRPGRQGLEDSADDLGRGREQAKTQRQVSAAEVATVRHSSLFRECSATLPAEAPAGAPCVRATPPPGCPARPPQPSQSSAAPVWAAGVKQRSGPAAASPTPGQGCSTCAARRLSAQCTSPQLTHPTFLSYSSHLGCAAGDVTLTLAVTAV